MVKKILALCGICLLTVSLMGLKCGEEPQKSTSVTSFCLSGNDLSGWSVWANECRTLLPADLNGVDENTGGIDGGSSYYTDKGMQEYIYQQLTSGTKSVNIYVMDCQSAANAQTIFEAKKSSASNQLTVTSYDANTAIIGIFGGGAVYELYAKLDKFYFQLTFSGLADDNEAKGMAEFVLGIYEGKM